MEEPPKPHVAILPSPGMGHVIPLLELAKRLVTHHGFIVSFIAITTEASPAQARLLHSSVLPDGLRVIDLPPVDVSNHVNDDMTVVARVSVIVRESLRALPSVLATMPRPKALVVDLFGTDAFETAKQLGIPNYLFITTSAALLALLLHLPTLDREVEGEFIDLPGLVHVPGCKPIRVEDLVDQLRNRKIDEYKWTLYHSSRFHMAEGILVNTCDEVEPISLRALREDPILQQLPTPSIYAVGPLVKADEPVTTSEMACLRWLDMQPPGSVLFVCFGSGGTLSAGQLNELAWGLEMSQHRFVWVAQEPIETKAYGVFFSAGSERKSLKDYLPDGFMERTKGVGLVIPAWAPQVSVLGHPSTGGFISHCGWNSIMESLINGVPIIAWPLFAEQKMNATLLTEQVRVAVRPVISTEKGVVKREEIERVVRLVMEGEEGKAMRCKVKALQAKLLRGLDNGGLDNGGSSYDSLSSVAKTWKGI